MTSHTAKLTGEATPDSPAIKALLRMFPGCERSTHDLPEEFYIVNEQTAFEALCRNIHEDSPFTASLLAYLKEGEYAPKIEQVMKVLRAGAFRMQDREISRMLFGSRMRLSPSRVERYFTCRLLTSVQAGLICRHAARWRFPRCSRGPSSFCAGTHGVSSWRKGLGRTFLG